MADSDIQWGTILKDSLVIIILGIIYLIICINCIVLVKFFPHYRSKKSLQNKSGIYKNQTILDAIFPTDLELPPYNSYKSAFEDMEYTNVIKSEERKHQKADINSEIKQVAKDSTERERMVKEKEAQISHIDPFTPGECGYQEAEQKWANEIHKFIYGLHNNVNMNDHVEWPYRWLESYNPKKNSNWPTWYFKYKIANMLANQQWFARSLMKGLLGQKWWGLVPDWVLFLSIPLGQNLVSSLVPLLPAIIGFYLTYVVGIVLAVVSIMTYLWVWLPPSLHKFDCNKEAGPFTGDTTLSKYMNKLTNNCSPNIWGQLCMFILMCLTGWLFTKSLSWWRNGIDINPSGWFAWLEGFIRDLGDFALLLLVFITFAIFMWSGGFLIMFGAASMTVVWLQTLFKLFLPTFIYPAGIFNVFYCNKDIITILLTAIVTLNIQQQNLLPPSVTGTMWGVWGILLLMKVLSSAKNMFSDMKQTYKKN
jgi:hypothetical protein